MKKHIKPLIICISIALAAAGLFFTASKHSDVGLIASDIESLAKWECVSSSSTNTGHCSERVDGNGDSCVKATLFQVKNCHGEIEL